MENQTIGSQTPTKENLNSVAQKEIDEIKKRFTKNEPIYEERTKKLFGFIPIGKEKVATDTYAEVFTNKTAENYVNALSRFMNNSKKTEDDLLKIAEHHKDIFTPNVDVKEFIKNKIKDETAYQKEINVDYSIDKIHEQAKQEAQKNKEQEGEKQGGDDGREHLTREHTLPNTLKDMKRAEKLTPKNQSTQNEAPFQSFDKAIYPNELQKNNLSVEDRIAKMDKQIELGNSFKTNMEEVSKEIDNNIKEHQNINNGNGLRIK